MLIHQPLIYLYWKSQFNFCFDLWDGSPALSNLCHPTKHIYCFCEVFLILRCIPPFVSLIDSAALPAEPVHLHQHVTINGVVCQSNNKRFCLSYRYFTGLNFKSLCINNLFYLVVSFSPLKLHYKVCIRLHKSVALVQFSSVAQLCPTLCDPMNCSTPGLTLKTYSFYAMRCFLFFGFFCLLQSLASV